jgi:TolA-binding protein
LRLSRPGGRTARALLAAAFLALAAGSPGCAYYNTFFLAKKHFNQALRDEKLNTTGKLSPVAATNYEKAIKQCSKVLQRHAGSKWADDALFLMGRSYFGREEYGQARRWFEELVAKYPKSDFVPEARFWVGRTWLAEENLENARSEFEKVLADYPNFEQQDEVYFFLAEVELSQENYAAAVERYETLVSRFSKSEYVPDALIRIGDARFSEKKYDLAEKSYQRAMSRTRDARDRFDARLKVGQALEQQDRHKEALETYRQMAWELVPRDKLNAILSGADYVPDPATGLNQPSGELPGTYIDENGNVVQPNPAFPRNNPAISPGTSPDDPQNFDPNNPPQVNPNYGPDGNQASRLAVSAAVQANPLASELPRVLLRQGMSLSEVGETEEAIKIFKAITGAYPRTSEAAEAQYRIGYIQEVALEDYAAARLAYDAVRQQGTSIFSEQARRRAEGLARLVALQAADTLEATPGATNTQADAAEKDFLAAELYYFQQDKPDKALEQYALVEKNYPATPFAARAALARAWILTFAMEDTAAGRQAYEDVMEQYPRTEQAGIARQILTGEAPVKERPVVPPDSLLARMPPDSAFAPGFADTLSTAFQPPLGPADSVAAGMNPRQPLVEVVPVDPLASTKGSPVDSSAVAPPEPAPVDMAAVERARRMNDSLAVVATERRISEAESAAEARRMADSVAAAGRVVPPVAADTTTAVAPRTPAGPPGTNAGPAGPPALDGSVAAAPVRSMRTSRLAPASATGLPRPLSIKGARPGRGGRPPARRSVTPKNSPAAADTSGGNGKAKQP